MTLDSHEHQINITLFCSDTKVFYNLNWPVVNVENITYWTIIIKLFE